MKTKIYSVFPACGKTWLYKHQDDYGIKILDSDSSRFSWDYTCVDQNGNPIGCVRKVRNPNFPQNYIDHIKENIGKVDYIFVSSHDLVRNALDIEGIDFTIVYPEHRCKEEWIGRCFVREMQGEDGCRAEVMYDNFDDWVMDCFKTGINHDEIVLKAQEYLSDYFK